MWTRLAALEALLLIAVTACGGASPSPNIAADDEVKSDPVPSTDAGVASPLPITLSSNSGSSCSADQPAAGCACEQVGKTMACDNGGVRTCVQSGESATWGPCNCTPTTCKALGADCGSVSDGCGGTLECGTCSAPADPHGDGRITCGGGGTPNVCGCKPVTCGEVDANCGTISDRCGGTLDCGSCPRAQRCGGSTPNVCCKPTTCAEVGANCGSFSDGCGGTLECGSCAGYDSCGGGGAKYVCGCTPTTCAKVGANCGSVPDGCGGTLECGSCTGYDSCGGGGANNVCGCTPVACSTCGGSVSDGCGGTQDCGACVCAPGSTQDCEAYDVEGTQTCDANGDAWGPCQ